MKKIVTSMIFLLVLGLFAPAFAGTDMTYAEWELKMAEYQKREEAAKALFPELEEAIAKLKEELEPLLATLKECTDAVDELRAKIAELKAQPKIATHVVESGECLWKISGYDKYYGDPVKWPNIYRSNRDKIKDPNLIYPGWELKIPLGKLNQYTVMKGDWLIKIAGYWEIYNDWRQWTKIYESNKDQIKNADLIYPGQNFKIPR